MAEENKEALSYTPTQKETEVVNRVWTRFNRMKDERDKPRHEFDGKTITEYVNYSMDAYNGIVSAELKATKEDWQSLIWDHETRGKLKTIVSNVVGSRPFMSLIGETEADHSYAADMLEVFDDSWKKENGAYKLYEQTLSTACKGTVIVEEMYVEETVKRKEIISVDQETGAVKFEEKTVIRNGAGSVQSRIFPLLQFYPNENSAEIKHDCCTLELFTEDKFREKYGNYPKAKYITPGTFISGTDLDAIYYKSVGDRRNNLIEVLKYFNEDVDELVILANGFWINAQSGEQISPIPFDHKRLPFSKSVFELADEECFYGKSFPDLLSGEQQTRNALLRLMVDQEVLSINKPILLGMGTELESYEIYPGKTIKMTGDISQMKEMEMSGSSQSAMQLLQMLKGSSDVNTSISPTAQGVGSGRKTAREAVILDENAKKISGTFMINIYKLLFDRANLRIPNIQQFYTTPIHLSVLKDKYGKDALDSNNKKIPAGKQFRKIPVVKPGKEPVWISMRPEMKGIKLNITLVEDFEVSQNRSFRIEMSKSMLDEAKVNPLINADNSTIDYLEALGKNPDKYYIKPDQNAKDFQENKGLPPVNNTQQ